jgi:hypothetical protein
MAVAFDAVSVKAASGSQNPSWTHTPVGTPSGVGIGIVMRDASGDLTISSVTYGGNACSLEDSQITGSGFEKVFLYSLANPPSGAQTVQVNFAAVPDRNACAHSVSVTGGSTSDVFGTPVKATGNDNSIEVDVSSDTDELVMDVAGAAAAIGVGAGQTQRMNEALDGATGVGSTEPGAATVTMSWTLGGASDWATVAASFNVAAAGDADEALTGSASTGGQTTPAVGTTVPL